MRRRKRESHTSWDLRKISAFGGKHNKTTFSLGSGATANNSFNPDRNLEILFKLINLTLYILLEKKKKKIPFSHPKYNRL